MPTLTCDNCERLIDIPAGYKGSKIACPDCGDINRIPESASEARDRGLPPDSGPEQTVMSVHPSMFRAKPLLFSTLTLLFLSGIAGLVIGIFGLVAGIGLPIAIAGGIVAIFATVMLIIWRIKTMNARFIVTNKRTVERRGLFSKYTTEVVHDNIRNIEIDQTFWQRIWGVGDIGIASSGHEGIEIKMEDLARPYKVREIIDRYREL